MPVWGRWYRLDRAWFLVNCHYLFKDHTITAWTDDYTRYSLKSMLGSASEYLRIASMCSWWPCRIQNMPAPVSVCAERWVCVLGVHGNVWILKQRALLRQSPVVILVLWWCKESNAILRSWAGEVAHKRMPSSDPHHRRLTRLETLAGLSRGCKSLIVPVEVLRAGRSQSDSIRQEYRGYFILWMRRDTWGVVRDECLDRLGYFSSSFNCMQVQHVVSEGKRCISLSIFSFVWYKLLLTKSLSPKFADPT